MFVSVYTVDSKNVELFFFAVDMIVGSRLCLKNVDVVILEV